MKTDILKQFADVKRSLATEADQIKSRLQDIERALGAAAISTSSQNVEVEIEVKPKRGPGRPKGTRNKMSRNEVASLAAKARWAKIKAQKGQAVIKTEAETPSRPKRKYSAEGKARVVAGIKARWAKYRAEKGLTAPEAAKPGPAKPDHKKTLATTPTAKPVQESKPAKKRKISAAGRAAMVAAGKARWAKAKGKK